MARYFLEVSYKGTRYSGFQVQQNALTIQAEVEKALQTFYKQAIKFTGSSRTDAGVHALCNFFHFDTELSIQAKHFYNINSLLPSDIVLKNIYAVGNDNHARFDAISREYNYHIYQNKNPFINDRAWFYPFKLDIEKLQQAASILMQHSNFETFSKRNTQVYTYICKIEASYWQQNNDMLTYTVQSNRFLRGMVRGLVGTMLKVGKGAITIDQFQQIILSQNCNNADFTTPAHGLFLKQVNYPEGLLKPIE